MKIMIAAALGVGGATIFGSAMGFLFHNLTQLFRDIILSFAAGVMLAATVLGLILPSLEYGSLLSVILGIFAGAVCVNLLQRAVPGLHTILGLASDSDPACTGVNRVILFVSAIAIHNFPEGIAAGVSFGTDSLADALLIAGGIALQNIPEGMVIIGPMLSAGISRKRTFLCALFTGLVEVLGTVLGYYAVTAASVILPFALALAGGTMIYVISDEMIPQTHRECEGSSPTYALLGGFCLMLLFSEILN